MAFKKFAKKTTAKEAPRASSYARKKKEEEGEEVQDDFVEEPIEDTEDTYEEPAPAPAPAPRPAFRAPAQAQAPRQFAPRQAPQAQGDGRQALRLTGLFPGKRDGLLTGRLRTEDMQRLKELIDEALANNQMIALFLWENQVTKPNQPPYSLQANLTQAEKKSYSRNWGGGNIGQNRGGSYR